VERSPVRHSTRAMACCMRSGWRRWRTAGPGRDRVASLWWLKSRLSNNGERAMRDITFALVLVFIVLALGLMAWHFTRAREILNRWAQANSHEILTAELRLLRLGPFFWTTSRGQTVYNVTVRTPNGQERRGWVRCGGWFWGMFSDHAEVRWDE
jgi:hypothetical protein